MKTQMFRLLSASLAAMSLSTAAHAAIVYNNGGPTPNGNETTQWQQAEDFTFGSATTIDGAGVYIGSTGDGLSNWDGAFQYAIYGDAGGSPGAALASGSVTATTSDTGIPWFSGNAFLFEFNFNSAFNAAANTTYWLGLHASSDYAGRDELYFSTTNGNGTNLGQENFENQGSWSGNGQEHAFYLTGGAVPEPTTWALMILGMGGAGVALRRRRVLVAA